MEYCFFKSPIGDLLLVGNQGILHSLSFPGVEPDRAWQCNPAAFASATLQLREYFNGTRKVFNLQYELTGTQFQKNVLQNVTYIPYGTTVSYSCIAKQINSPHAVRAVGTANAKNKMPIIIPCHRVIGKNGSLTGFAGGINTKQFLLELEQAI